MKHVEKFRKDCPKTEDSFRKPASSERKLYEKKTARKPQAEIIVDRMEKPEKVKNQDPNISGTVVYKLHLRSMVPRKVERCQGNCGVKLEPSDETSNDYLVVKSFGRNVDIYGQRRVSFQIWSPICPFLA